MPSLAGIDPEADTGHTKEKGSQMTHTAEKTETTDKTTTDKTTSEGQDYKPLTREELNQLAGEELPERAAMSLINANVAAPINAALALNVLSDNSIAYANAEQTADIDQSN
jgi:hypothetical protein